MIKYWVTGGTYRDTGHAQPIGEEVKIGPFTTFAEAEKEWSRLAWQVVDDPNTRYRIESIEQYWVVGGEYEYPDFVLPVGGREERYGPFGGFVDAEKEWARLSMQHVNDVSYRYRIVDG